jgi:hypothetical protein
MVSRTLDRWETFGEAGLVYRREDNVQPKADEAYVYDGAPSSSTGGRLLIETARRYTGGVTVSKSIERFTRLRLRQTVGSERFLDLCNLLGNPFIVFPMRTRAWRRRGWGARCCCT